MSLWLDAREPPRPPLDGDTTADVAIAGAGIAGASLALALARDGAKVVVVDARHAGGGASGRNAGFVLAGVAENYVAACRKYGAERAARLWRFTLTNRTLLRALIERERIACEVRWNGSLQAAGTDEEWDEIRESVRLLAPLGARATLVEPERAALFADDGELHPVRLVQGIARAAERRGVRIREGTRATAASRGALVTERGTVRAGAVVVCAGAWSEHLVPRSRVVPIRGQMLATAPAGRTVFERPVYANRGFDYWRQTADGRVAVGGWRYLAFDEETGEDERTTDTVQRALDGFLQARGIDAPVTHRWAGIMDFSHDGLPYLGRRADGVYVAGGFTGHGNGFAYAGAELVASLIRAGRHPDAELFDPERA
ncbi:MAG TPA: FAD-dependent oxidoreductase [Candidatus Limnocylindria bacterium]|nr:FAD-dependent oxidoreductase [Candidatus Limnocylindria bacterium]